MTWEAVTDWTAPDGARLALRRSRPAGRTRAACLLVHGFGEHAGRYGRTVAQLAELGIATWALDQRGHGRSPGPRGHVSRFAQYVSDVYALRRAMSAEQPGPLFLLGHSHGGLVVLRYLESAPEAVAGAVVTSPLVAIAARVPRWKRVLARLAADVAPALPIPTGVDLAALSTDPAVVAAVRHDPLCHQVMTPRAWFELQDAMRVLPAERQRIAVPVFVGLAGDDRIADTPAAEAFAAGIPGDVTVRVYPGFAHEILNEPARARVWDDLTPWLRRRLGD